LYDIAYCRHITRSSLLLLVVLMLRMAFDAVLAGRDVPVISQTHHTSGAS